MAQSTTLRLRALWLQVHKWIGISLAILIIPVSVTGAALVWHDWLDAQINPQRYAVTSSEARLTPAQYAAAARRAAEARGGEARLASIRYPEGEGPIVATALEPPRGEGRPARTSIWIDPGNGAVLDAASGNSGLVQVFHSLHGSLMVPGWGRTIVGWIGVFMFISCLTGLWLWWPITGSVRRGFRWKRQNSANANLHHQLGFWIALPLAMLSFTGLWISFPSVFSTFEASQPKGKSEGGPGGPGRGAPPRPLADPATSADAALAAARPLSGGGRLVAITWPVENPRKVEWKFQFAREGGPVEIAVDDASGRASPPPPPRPETNARLMRRLHDGTGMGLVWQIIIFIGGIIPAVLAATGLVMWWRSRGWKAALAKKRKARALGTGEVAPLPAE